MDAVAIDTTRNTRLAVVLAHETVREVNDYRAARGVETGKIPSQSSALAELIQLALAQWRHQHQGKPK